jgi:hypothetical protein
MDENTIIEQLEELIKSFGVQIRREPIKQDEDLVKVVGGGRRSVSIKRGVCINNQF